MTKKTTTVARLAALSGRADARPARVTTADGAPALAACTDSLVDGEPWYPQEPFRPTVHGTAPVTRWIP